LLDADGDVFCLHLFVVKGVLGIIDQVDQDLGELPEFPQDIKLLGRNDGRPDGMVLEGSVHDLQSLGGGIVDTERFIFLIRTEEVSKVIDSLGHLVDEIPALAVGLIHVFRIQFLQGEALLEVKEQQPQGIDGLTPLVGDVAQHLAHGSQFGLLDQDLLLLQLLLIEGFLLSDIHDGHDQHHIATGIADGVGAGEDRQRCVVFTPDTPLFRQAFVFRGVHIGLIDFPGLLFFRIRKDQREGLP